MSRYKECLLIGKNTNIIVTFTMKVAFTTPLIYDSSVYDIIKYTNIRKSVLGLFCFKLCYALSPSKCGADCLMELAVVAKYQVNHSRKQRNCSQDISLMVAEKKRKRKFKRNSPSAALDTKTSIVNDFINLLGLVIKKNLLAKSRVNCSRKKDIFH